MSSPKSNAVSFAKVDEWHNNPCFKTRLKQSVDRAIEIYTQPFIRIVVIGLTIVGMFCSYNVSKDEFLKCIFTITSGSSAAFIATIGTIYWNLDSIYGRKWSLIFEQWYQINRLKNESTKAFHFCNLYMDVITMKLWGDPGIAGAFKRHLIEAIFSTVSDGERLSVIYRLENGEFTTYEAHEYFSKYAVKIRPDLEKSDDPVLTLKKVE